jgi:hypothetical protein
VYYVRYELRLKKQWITLFNTQNVMETRLAKLYYLEAAEFENDIEIFNLALVFELQLWPEISLFFSTKYYISIFKSWQHSKRAL